jgi:hypothetical protein
MLYHESCGGLLTIDRTQPHTQEQGEGDETHIWRGIKCSKCGQKIGMLPDATEAVN